MYWHELTTGIYPWDVHDEGIETILDNLQNEAGCNAAYMISLMHHEKRPLHDNYYHHNPVRKRYVAEDSRAYWLPDPAAYVDSRIKPLTSDREFLKGTDWLDVFVKAVRKRGMRPGAEISHTPLDKVRAGEEFADCIQRDVYGHRLGQQLCWNNPDARAYMTALAVDLVTHYDIAMLQTCSALFAAGRANLHPLLGVTLGGCFCDHCKAVAGAAGLDWDAITRTVRSWADVLTRATVELNEDRLLLNRGNSTPAMLLLEQPELFHWLRFRCESTTSHFAQLSAAIHAARADVDFRLNTCWPRAERVGLDLRQVAPHLDSVRTMDYAEQTGDIEKVRRKGKWLANVRRQVGDDKRIISAIAPRAKATPELIKLGIKTVALGGADGLSFGFYDGATIERLRAIREGMAEAEVALIDEPDPSGT